MHNRAEVFQRVSLKNESCRPGKRGSHKGIFCPPARIIGLRVSITTVHRKLEQFGDWKKEEKGTTNVVDIKRRCHPLA
jgi:hypothetical protein